MLIGGTVQAGEVEVMLTQWNRIADGEKYQVGNWQGVQLNYKFNSGAYIFGSYDNVQIIPLWGIGDMRMAGIGGGLKYDLTPRLSIFGQIGYYAVHHENEGRRPVTNDGGAGEGMEYYFNDKFAFIPGDYHHFDEYDIQYEDALAGIFGVQFVYPIGKQSNLGFAFSYRSMKIAETFIVYKDEWRYEETGWRWEQRLERGMDAFGMSLVFTQEF
jgi:hypothetical protein